MKLRVVARIDRHLEQRVEKIAQELLEVLQQLLDAVYVAENKKNHSETATLED